MSIDIRMAVRLLATDRANSLAPGLAQTLDGFNASLGVDNVHALGYFLAASPIVMVCGIAQCGKSSLVSGMLFDAPEAALKWGKEHVGHGAQRKTPVPRSLRMVVREPAKKPARVAAPKDLLIEVDAKFAEVQRALAADGLKPGEGGEDSLSRLTMI